MYSLLRITKKWKDNETSICFKKVSSAWENIAELFSTCISQFSRSVMSDSLLPHEAQHTRPPCPSPTPGVHTNPCPLSR